MELNFVKPLTTTSQGHKCMHVTVIMWWVACLDTLHMDGKTNVFIVAFVCACIHQGFLPCSALCWKIWIDGSSTKNSSHNRWWPKYFCIHVKLLTSEFGYIYIHKVPILLEIGVQHWSTSFINFWFMDLLLFCWTWVLDHEMPFWYNLGEEEEDNVKYKHDGW